MITCTRILKSDTGHRVLGHEGKCSHAHGHEYKYEITAISDDLDRIGRVIDFSVIKEKIGGWIDRNWDHNFIVYKADRDAIEAMKLFYNGKEPFVSDWNPTAENIAFYLLNTICPKELAGSGVKVIKVKVQETSNCYAEASI